MRFFYKTLLFDNPGPDPAEVLREYQFSKDALIVRLCVSLWPSLFFSAISTIELRLNSESLLSQGAFAPFLLAAGPFCPKLHIPVKGGERLLARWFVPPGRSHLSFAYREALGERDLAKESHFYVVKRKRRDGVTLLQPNVQKSFLWEGLFVYDTTMSFLAPPGPALVTYPEVLLPVPAPRMGPAAIPSLIDDVVQVRDYPSEFLLDYLPLSSIGGRGPAHYFQEPIPIESQRVINIGVVSKTKVGGEVTAMILGTHVREGDLGELSHD